MDHKKTVKCTRRWIWFLHVVYKYIYYGRRIYIFDVCAVKRHVLLLSNWISSTSYAKGNPSVFNLRGQPVWLRRIDFYLCGIFSALQIPTDLSSHKYLCLLLRKNIFLLIENNLRCLFTAAFNHQNQSLNVRVFFSPIARMTYKPFGLNDEFLIVDRL